MKRALLFATNAFVRSMQSDNPSSNSDRSRMSRSLAGHRDASHAAARLLLLKL